MTRERFNAVLERAAAGWAGGDAAAVADCFAEAVDYGDPYRYRFTRRDELLPFFEPPPGGHRVTWHTRIWDDASEIGVVEYTYEGHHRYHGAAVVHLDADGRIDRWREWQHLDDALDWDARLAGPPIDAAVLATIDHVQLDMPAGREDDARAFYRDLLGLREVSKPAALAVRGGVWFAGRSVAVHLGVETDFRPARKAHPGFVVDDLAAVRSRFAAASVAIVEDDVDIGIDRCYVADPFGNRIELVDAADAGFSMATASRWDQGGVAGYVDAGGARSDASQEPSRP